MVSQRKINQLSKQIDKLKVKVEAEHDKIAKALDMEPHAFAFMLVPIEVLEGFDGSGSDGDQVRVIHDDPPFLQPVPGQVILGGRTNKI